MEDASGEGVYEMRNNKGSASIEASIALPLYLFTMLFFVYLGTTYTVKSTVYEGCIETAEYMAEYAYLADCFDTAEKLSPVMAKARFLEYADSKALLEEYVVGGALGVSFIGSQFPDDKGFIDLKVTYFIRIKIPLIKNFNTKCTEHIRQRAYLGRRLSSESDSGKSNGADKYVYVAENGVVYHNSRSCTYLLPKITSCSKKSAQNKGYKKCKYCNPTGSGEVFITEYGDCYHSSRSCSRLKRNVERKKLSEVSLPPCSKCVR